MSIRNQKELMMKIRTYLAISAAVLLLGLSGYVNSESQNNVQDDTVAKTLVIQTDKIFDPDKLSVDSLQEYDKNFKYDWNNFSNIEVDRKKITDIENFIANFPSDDIKKLSPEDKTALARLSYKVGSYYTHVTRQPDEAIKHLALADEYLVSKADRAWNYNQLAYAYEEKFALTEDEMDEKKGLDYVRKVRLLYPRMRNQQIAFICCVQGLFQNDAKDSKEAETTLKNALAIYETIPGGKSDQYMRYKADLAAIMLTNDENDEALSMLQELKQYWIHKGKLETNPYAAVSLLTLSQVYLKLNKIKEAQQELAQVISIYQNIFGNDSELLVQPYQLLADSYRSLGNQQLADEYQVKANMVDKS